MIRRPPIVTRTDPLVPYTPLSRSRGGEEAVFVVRTEAGEAVAPRGQREEVAAGVAVVQPGHLRDEVRLRDPQRGVQLPSQIRLEIGEDVVREPFQIERAHV